MQPKINRILLHTGFWVLVACFYFFLFSWKSEYREISVIFSAGLLPVAIIVTYFFNYILIPRYLWEKRYIRFFLFSFYTILAAVWFSFLIVFYTLLFILQSKSSIAPSVLNPGLQIITLNFVVFFAIAIKQVKRVYFIQLEKNQLEKTKLMTELKLREAELKLLKAQIHPHFLFNTLNNLYGLTLEKSDEAPGLVLRLSEILDYVLYRCNDEKVFLADELNILKNYIEIEKIRYPENVILTHEFPENTGQLKIAPLLFLPLIENAFKHGVSKFPGRAYVNLKVSVEVKLLSFTIENSFIHPNKVITEASNGIGLINLRKRLDMLYPGKYFLKISKMPHAYSVNLKIELEE